MRTKVLFQRDKNTLNIYTSWYNMYKVIILYEGNIGIYITLCAADKKYNSDDGNESA